MERKPPAKDDETPQEAVQDYLDLMLSPQNDNDESPVSLTTSSKSVLSNDTPTAGKPTAALTMVAGTALPSIARVAAPEHGSAVKPQRRHSDITALKPFAEPVKPLTLKMPLSEVKPTDSVPGQKVKTEQRVEVEQQVKPVMPSDEPVAKSAKTPVTNDVKIKTSVKTVEALPTTSTAGVADDKEQIAESVDTTQTAPDSVSTSEWLENGRPAWAQQRFECLLFTVSGLTLAVPLVELGAIYSIGDEITPIFGQADWFLGLLSVKDRNIRAVNTAKVVMPERYSTASDERFSYVITINGVDWGLAVDSVSEAIALEPDDVRWRSSRSKRPWLAGTVIDKMCALLDVSQLAAMFIKEERQR